MYMYIHTHTIPVSLNQHIQIFLSTVAVYYCRATMNQNIQEILGKTSTYFVSPSKRDTQTFALIRTNAVRTRSTYKQST